jgi:putative endonuclease
VSTVKGQLAEQCAAEYLAACGFRVVARNVRLGKLEIDLVVESDEVVAVVEVRHRGSGSLSSALGSLASIKQRRVALAADRLFRARYVRDPHARRFRIDVCIVHSNGEVEHFPAAITMGKS